MIGRRLCVEKERAQGMYGYASDETHSITVRLVNDVRKNGDLRWLRPDGETQATIEYAGKSKKRSLMLCV